MGFFRVIWYNSVRGKRHTICEVEEMEMEEEEEEIKEEEEEVQNLFFLISSELQTLLIHS